MQHLPIERLAELGDVEPTRDEAAHLASCAQCARERAAYRQLAGLASGERSRIRPPLTDWSQLRSRLSEDGLLTSESREWRVAALGSTRKLLQMAAAALLIVGGLFAGRLSAGMSYSQALAFKQQAPSPEAAAATDFSSTDEALEVLNRAYQQYSSAATYLAANDTVSSGQAFERFRSRLAFLDEVAQSTREALAEAPQDPLINQFYVSTLGARDATLQRMGQVVSFGNRLGRF
ncbi:MAG: hypothetical protein ACT4P6_10790 [Gemmatimonadaceae bacterium]